MKKENTNKYAAISADIVSSTSLSSEDIKKLQLQIKALLVKFEQYFNGFWGRLVKGDSIECVMEHPSDALRVALMLKAFVKSFVPSEGEVDSKFKRYGLRLAIGVGTMRTVDKEIDMIDGEAIYLSGRALADMSEKTSNSFQFVMNDDISRGAMRIIMIQLNQMINSATGRQCETLFYRLQYCNDAQVAEKMGITRSGANNNLRNIGWSVVESALDYYEQLDFN